ncbi:TetR/AcrR family transcriptional regulator [Nocardia panacis]|uniref:TetR/AcrR family transcriptional regulator n=1 Tax=Nocardia panacis TaxID=2340916 RepID=A0A3A4KBN1_9NOCA|nr:TetR/AcrR family transcriptional regulator [Nocardia panacis]RJO71021.1 TetR/AcrR family transcriptional regulator [Nocardia panacis]
MKIRDRLLLAAEQQFAEHGAVDTTLGQIRAAAGASVGALYHHFPDKSDLYRQVWEHAMADYQRAFWGVLGEATDARDGVTGAVRQQLRWVTENQSRAKVLVSARPLSTRDSESNREFLRNTHRWWRTHVGYGTVRDLPLDLLYALWLGPTQVYARHWLEGISTTAPTAIADELATAAWETLRTPDHNEDGAAR